MPTSRSSVRIAAIERRTESLCHLNHKLRFAAHGNNVAEYRALLLGLGCARELGAIEIEVVGDSELIAKQVQGVYKVRHEDMRRLHSQAMAALRGFERWSIRTVPRARNARADALVNAALDGAPAPSPS